MENRRSRRSQQRGRMLLIAGIVIVVLAAAVLGITTGAFGKAGLFQRNDPAGSSAAGTAGTSEASPGSSYGNASGTASGGQAADLIYDGKKYVYNDHLTNYLLLGVDTSGSIKEKREPGKAGQSDFIFLISYDRLKKTAVGLSIPRETVTQIERFTPDGDSLGFSMDFLTLQYAYGDGVRRSCTLSVEAVSRLMEGIPIGGYAAINLESIPELAELVGGVEVTVPDDTLADRDPSFTRGSKVVLGASNTSLFIRSRDTSAELSTAERRERQKIFLSAFADKLAREQRKDASTISTILDRMKQEMITNMSNDVFADLATAKRSGGVQTIPGTESHEGFYDVFRVDDAALYKMAVDLFYREVQ